MSIIIFNKLDILKFKFIEVVSTLGFSLLSTSYSNSP